MVVFLTSSPTGPLDNSRPVDGVDRKNGFLTHLKKYWKEQARCLIISAFPSDDAANDDMQVGMADAMRRSGLSVGTFDVWDDRTKDYSAECLQSYDIVFLGGGHVPTENEFFHRIDLRNKMKTYDGVVIGISAGTMNAADIVYVQPELPGEAVDPEFRREAMGLGLTKTNILPHYQMVKNWMLDGMRLFEEITYGDSRGRAFLALPDGSYLLQEAGEILVFGEAYRIADGVLEQIGAENEVHTLTYWENVCGNIDFNVIN